MFCMRTRSLARANDAKIVRSRDAQCNTKELPYAFCPHAYMYFRRYEYDVIYLIKTSA